MPGMTTCCAELHMYDGEYEGECKRAAGHDGAHFDGLTTWHTVDGWTDHETIDLDADEGLKT